jgi:sarcosine oxidase, subunit gamma
MADWMRILPPCSRMILHGGAEARAIASLVWGTGFSETPCRAIVHENRATLWLGPDEYLLWQLGRPPGETTFLSIEQVLQGTPHALVEVSHRQIGLEIFGPRAENILNGACPLDLDIAKFPVGMCTRTVLAKADIVLWRCAHDTFRLEVWRSFADYAQGLLREIASGVEADF